MYKKDFPIFRKNDLVFLDSASTSQKPQSVISAVDDFYRNYNSNINRGLYGIAEKSSKKVNEVRTKIKDFINAKSDHEIIFTKSSTEGINFIMYSWAKKNISTNDIVVATVLEHHANFVPWQIVSRSNEADFRVVGIDQSGELSMEEILSKAKTAKLFCVTYASNVLGNINNLGLIISEVKKINPQIKVMVDASQAAAHLRIDVNKLNCDFLVITGHKMFAETGIGVLYIKESIQKEVEPFLYGGDMIEKVTQIDTLFAEPPRKYEAGTLNISGIISLGAAVEYIENIGFDAIKKYEDDLIDYFITKTKSFGNINFIGKIDSNKKVGIFSFNIHHIHPHDIAEVLARKNICVRAGHHCAMPLHAYFDLNSSVRVSLSIYNTKEDIDLFIDGLSEAVRIFK